MEPSNHPSATPMPQPCAGTKAPPTRFRGMIGLILTLTGVTAATIIAGMMMRPSGPIAYQTPDWAIAIHLATVIPAFLLGAWLMWARKGTHRHKMAGRIWMSLMAITAIDSFWIRSLTGGISPIHALSVLTLYSIPAAIWHIRRGNVAGHQRAVRGMFIGLCIAGVFAMMPGRLIGGLLFGA